MRTDSDIRTLQKLKNHHQDSNTRSNSNSNSNEYNNRISSSNNDNENVDNKNNNRKEIPILNALFGKAGFLLNRACCSSYYNEAQASGEPVAVDLTYNPCGDDNNIATWIPPERHFNEYNDVSSTGTTTTTTTTPRMNYYDYVDYNNKYPNNARRSTTNKRVYDTPVAESRASTPVAGNGLRSGGVFLIKHARSWPIQQVPSTTSNNNRIQSKNEKNTSSSSSPSSTRDFVLSRPADYSTDYNPFNDDCEMEAHHYAPSITKKQKRKIQRYVPLPGSPARSDATATTVTMMTVDTPPRGQEWHEEAGSVCGGGSSSGSNSSNTTLNRYSPTQIISDDNSSGTSLSTPQRQKQNPHNGDDKGNWNQPNFVTPPRLTPSTTEEKEFEEINFSDAELVLSRSFSCHPANVTAPRGRRSPILSTWGENSTEVTSNMLIDSLPSFRQIQAKQF